MRITIFGTGGIGGYLSGKLGSLLTTHKGLDSLSLVARGEHLATIKQQGLRFIDVEGTEHRIQPTLATNTPKELPEADLTLLCVKGYDLQDAAKAIKDKVAPGGAVLPLLNGADIRERVKSQLPNTVV
ncbi:MAG: 2-dehydropantoate 2-reductase, partial [Spirochaetia bacterium]